MVAGRRGGFGRGAATVRPAEMPGRSGTSSRRCCMRPNQQRSRQVSAGRRRAPMAAL
jgi:hypothetical protein